LIPGIRASSTPRQFLRICGDLAVAKAAENLNAGGQGTLHGLPRYTAEPAPLKFRNRSQQRREQRDTRNLLVAAVRLEGKDGAHH
jgi:hypothetical protein